jgi:hypothetical protein
MLSLLVLAFWAAVTCHRFPIFVRQALSKACRFRKTKGGSAAKKSCDKSQQPKELRSGKQIRHRLVACRLARQGVSTIPRHQFFTRVAVLSKPLRAGTSVANRSGLSGANRSNTNRFVQLRHAFAETGELAAARGYASQSELVATFGLGEQAQVDCVTIRWPGPHGGTQVLTDVSIDRVHDIRQAASQ